MPSRGMTQTASEQRAGGYVAISVNYADRSAILMEMASLSRRLSLETARARPVIISRADCAARNEPQRGHCCRSIACARVIGDVAITTSGSESLIAVSRPVRRAVPRCNRGQSGCNSAKREPYLPRSAGYYSRYWSSADQPVRRTFVLRAEI